MHGIGRKGINPKTLAGSGVESQQTKEVQKIIDQCEGSCIVCELTQSISC